MSLNGYDDETSGYNTVVKNGVSSNINLVKAVLPPIGAIISWAKTFNEISTSDADGTTANKLIDSGANFVTDGVAINYVVYNLDDDTWTYVTAVDSATQLSIADDIFISGEEYHIYSVPYLPDGWVECDGSVLSDSDSPFDGATLPDLNSTQSFLRGSSSSGTTGGEDTHTLTTAEMPAHVHSQAPPALGAGSGGWSSGSPSGSLNTGSAGSSNAHNNLPVYYEVVMIMRIK